MIKLFYLGTSGNNPEKLFSELEEQVNKFITENNLSDFEVETSLNGGYSPEFGFVTEAVVTLKYWRVKNEMYKM